jgi:hypothetical protein
MCRTCGGSRRIVYGSDTTGGRIDRVCPECVCGDRESPVVDTSSVPVRGLGIVYRDELVDVPYRGRG